MSAITIIIADSIDSCREHLENFILKNQPNYQLLYTATNAQEVLYASKQFQPHLIVIDVNLQGMCTAQLCREVLQNCAGTRIVARASEDIAYHARRMVGAGALGILSKHACNAELKYCLNWVHQGNPHLPAECRHLQRENNARHICGGSRLFARGIVSNKCYN